MKCPRVILADDHTLMLDALKKLIEPEFEVVGTFADGHSLVDAAPALNPSVIVLDIGMPTMNGLNAGHRLKQLMPLVKLVYLTMNHDPDIAGEAFRLGASAFLLKNSAATELLHAIRQVVRGGYYVTPLMTEGMDGSFVQNLKERKTKYSLTLRQKEVLQLLAEGRSMKQVAFVLNVSPRTVAFHKYTMMEHLHIRSSAELIEYAMRSSLAPMSGTNVSLPTVQVPRPLLPGFAQNVAEPAKQA
jgi:DNA-binding NarL/FixJ family response regulator